MHDTLLGDRSGRNVLDERPRVEDPKGKRSARKGIKRKGPPTSDPSDAATDSLFT